MVCIKTVKDETEEAVIACFLSSEDKLKEPFNHCVRILEVLPDPIDPAQQLLVMPYLHPFNNPPFDTVEEAVDFIGQTLEVRYNFQYHTRYQSFRRDFASSTVKT